MKKYFGCLLAVLFLAAQVFSNLHMAEHGFAEHKHNGHVCDVYLYCEQGKIAGATAPKLPAATSFITLAPLPLAVPLLAQAYHHLGIPRAPPTQA